ncbi:MAG TPA: TetR/AcrR family transcriptional regulator [Pseudonocardiaceae bacterium]|jgi:AcrR family transcriptional regulator|nr:TetR/AcrR family transcriptional regulator [Pseudonocardiaceae bacterium]
MTPESTARPAPSAGDDQARPGRRRCPQAHEAILEATIEILQEVGYPRLTVEGVAARAGVGKTTIYRWWPTKSSLVLEAINRCLDLPSPQPTGDTRADVRAVVQRIADTFGRPPLGEVLPSLAVDLTREPETAAALRAMLGPRRAANAAVLYSAVGRGDLPQDLDAHALLDVVAGAILYRCMLRSAPTATLIDQLTDLILDGRLPRTPAPAW